MDDNVSQHPEILSFFSALQAKRESYAEFMKLYDPSLASRFNVFDFINPDENLLSEIIAFLLDPAAEHGQGDIFLRIFLDTVQPQHLGSPTGKVALFLEKATGTIENAQRRLDIEVAIGNFGLAIENKPWAYDQTAQIADYSQDLKNRYGDSYCLIYLSGWGEPPSEESISRERRELLENSGHMKTLSYRDFIGCVSLFKTHCQSEKVRHFLGDFEGYLKREFEGERVMYEKDLIIKDVLSNPKNLEIALTVANYRDDIKIVLMERFKKSFAGKLPDGLEMEWEIEDWWGRDQYFAFKKVTWKNYMIAFQFGGAEGNGLGYGVSKIAEENPDLPGLNEKLGEGQHDEWWPWYQDFETPYNDWKNSVEPWVAILTGDMTDKIMKKVEQIQKVLDQIENV